MNQLKKSLYAWISRRFMNDCSSYNSLEVRRGCRSKEQARAIFADNRVPHAKGLVWLNPWKAHQFAKRHGFPLVIKPNVGGFSRGSHFPINDFRSLWKAALLVKIWWPTSVVEQYLLGANYRVLSTRDQIISVIRRYPPFVDGDGTRSISELIDEENRVRKTMQLLPTIHTIQKNEPVVQYLRKQGLALSSVPANDQRVYLYHRVALAPGGVVEVVPQDHIPAANLNLFKEIVGHFNANLLGIDVIFEEGIEKPWQQQRCIFLEVNSRPYIKMHHMPRYGEPEDLSAFYTSMEELEIADTDTF